MFKKLWISVLILKILKYYENDEQIQELIKKYDKKEQDIVQMKWDKTFEEEIKNSDIKNHFQAWWGSDETGIVQILEFEEGSEEYASWKNNSEIIRHA